jgi:putative transcriptional regulator
MMDKKLFGELLTSVKQAGEILRGDRKPSRVFRFSESRVRAIRARTQLSQGDFARLLGVSVKTLQNWEQARRHPTGPAAALLRIVEKDPKAALQALRR